MDEYDLAISIVLYKNRPKIVDRIIRNIVSTFLKTKIFVIDNSEVSILPNLHNIGKKVNYIFNGSNIGYGAAHNIAIKYSIKEHIRYHLVVNPDVYWEKGVLEKLYSFMEKNHEVGLVMPKVLYPDGSMQYLCKLLPTPFDLFGRRFLDFYPFKTLIKKRNMVYELRYANYNKVMEVPCLSGCFMFIRTDTLKQVGCFDERFFLYLEDTDLCRRISRVSKLIYYPQVYIYHSYHKGSYKKFILLSHHVLSAIKYFNKWGWFIDKERKRVNKDMLQCLLRKE